MTGKTVVAVSAGNAHSVALCSDGTLVAWGSYYLGINSTGSSGVPVAVNTDSGVSALFGKTVVQIVAGSGHNLALCSDGTLVAWGENGNGQIGDNATTLRSAPVAVNTDVGVSALNGKTVVDIAVGSSHSLALCSDGAVVAWGYNNNSQLGDGGTTQSLVPVAVDSSALGVGDRFLALSQGPVGNHSSAVVALAAVREIRITGNGAEILDGSTIASLGDHTDFGGAAPGGGSVVRTFTIENPESLDLHLIGTPRVAVSGPNAGDFTVTTQPDATVIGGGATTFQVTFSPGAVGGRSAILSIANDDSDENPSTFAIQGSGSVALAASYTTGTEVPMTTSGPTATGSTVNFTLNYAPPVGTQLTVVNHTGAGFLGGAFDNLAQGQTVSLSYGGNNYSFVANYFGGTGNDLVLVWKTTRVFAWGTSSNGRLGYGGTYQYLYPVAVDSSGLLAGKTVLSVVAGANHSLAVSSDGTVTAWGYNGIGQLGNGTNSNSNVPAAVNTDPGVSALNGKSVVSVAAGSLHSLALCSDGTVAAWGWNGQGNLGDGTTTQRLTPVAVNAAGSSVLHGRSVVAISVGQYHSLALCSDGTVAAWGGNSYGKLGDGTGVQQATPVAVSTASGVSALAGKTVIALAGGGDHNLALCSDGTVVAWGRNTNGQLGDNSSTSSNVPVAVNADSGVSALFGKTVVGIAAGQNHSLALCSDGTVVAWGINSEGQLGDNSTTQSLVPIAVNTTSGVSALFGKTVVKVLAGSAHSVALCSDGTPVAWGRNSSAQLGNNSTTQSLVPVGVNTIPFAASERAVAISTESCVNDHNLMIVAGPPPPEPEIAVSETSAGDLTSGVSSVDFGSTAVTGGTVPLTFTITNSGTATLSLTGTAPNYVTLTGSSAFSVTTQPASGTVPSGGNTRTFVITFDPATEGLHTATVSLANDDSDENPFTFDIRGTTPASVPFESAPPGLAVGSVYRLIFVTTGARDATSTDINVYNAFVTDQANAAPALAALGTTWKAIASTATVYARDNTGTNRAVSTGGPFYGINGLR
ncbi:MAG: choice-of-anchor D domain-containing protein, partial [Verrucomicrobiales bacterium]|nr:choice-of-anchor D domain-containing protein [Verrucomicrobiales bacterium]